MAIKPPLRNNLNFAAIKAKADEVNKIARPAPSADTGLLELPVDQIDVEPQIRTVFDEESIKELAASIKEHGQISPITVRKEGVRYVLITGERRLRAVRLLGAPSIKAIVQDNIKLPSEITVSQLIENLQREDMGPLEIGLAYCQLMKNENWSAEVAAQKTGKSARYVYRVTSVGSLPEVVQHWVAEKHLTDTVAIENLAKLYKASKTPEAITQKLEQVIARGMTITRAIVEGLSVPAVKKTPPTKVVPLKDVPLTITNASDLRRQKGYEQYDFLGTNFQMLCEFTHPSVNKGQPTRGGQLIPNMVPKDRSKTVVVFEGKIYEVAWQDVKVYETLIPGKTGIKAKKS